MCKMNFYDTLKVCSYLSLTDLYNILKSDVTVFDKHAVSEAMNKIKNNMSNYRKLWFFYDDPEVALKLFNFRNLCNQMFNPIKRSDFDDYIESEFFGSDIPDEYAFPFKNIFDNFEGKYNYYLLSRIIRRFPGFIEYIDDKVFGNKYFVRDFTLWKNKDRFIYDKIMNYIKDKNSDLYEKLMECEYYKDKGIDTYDTDDEEY